MSAIRSRVHQYGHKSESEWPPKYGNRKAGRCYYDKEKGRIAEGSPPQRKKYGTAPIAIMDSMEKTYHEGVGREIESRSEWKQADEQSGCLTFSGTEEIQRHTKKGAERVEREIKADRKKAIRTASQAYRENPKEVSAKVRARGQEQQKALKRAGINIKELSDG